MILMITKIQKFKENILINHTLEIILNLKLNMSGLF